MPSLSSSSPSHLQTHYEEQTEFSNFQTYRLSVSPHHIGAQLLHSRVQSPATDLVIIGHRRHQHRSTLCFSCRDEIIKWPSA
ncbi:hypothetical protein L6452_33319 [Arctium lappa]|uniref:Uncharacterized protein n=1 Tax=Arctium lappa TaxID=4217 RepID=A0ACB8Z736_ARCLA|nr:hypothetical protein L6452_33319 [Arctium lappa]